MTHRDTTGSRGTGPDRTGPDRTEQELREAPRAMAGGVGHRGPGRRRQVTPPASALIAAPTCREPALRA
ncbi:hypothetical protein GCM10010384_49590 [Streptomyces djakartensis]|uniref:Uncharacterized protein n=1 Tax=Streptomyces djakartensis TaxID=68193 RepID=A0ABQ3A572_9ACTN|nr:hypothetical protein GCM10010384_49590 [Streptomyces djakartensis]